MLHVIKKEMKYWYNVLFGMVVLIRNGVEEGKVGMVLFDF